MAEFGEKKVEFAIQKTAEFRMNRFILEQPVCMYVPTKWSVALMLWHVFFSGYGYGAASQFNQMSQPQQTMGQMMPGTNMPAANMAGTLPTAGSMAPVATGAMTNPAATAYGGMQQHMGYGQPATNVTPATNSMPQGKATLQLAVLNYHNNLLLIRDVWCASFFFEVSY